MTEMRFLIETAYWLWLIVSGRYKRVKPCLFWEDDAEWIPHSTNLVEFQGMICAIKKSMDDGAVCYLYECDPETGELTENEYSDLRSDL